MHRTVYGATSVRFSYFMRFEGGGLTHDVGMQVSSGLNKNYGFDFGNRCLSGRAKVVLE